MSSVEDESAASGAPRRELLEPLRVSVGKSATRLAYRLRYLRAFNGQPWEEAFSARGCRDGGFEDAPTCGWHTDPASGARVADSQGFCCECSAGDALKHTLEGGSDEQSRGNLDCGVFQNGLFWGGTPGSAHCLRWGDAWWAGYALEAPAVDFEIAVRLTRTGEQPAGRCASEAASGPLDETLALAPTRPVARSHTGKVLARLHGDLATWDYAQPATAGDEILFIRDDAESMADPDGWMLVRSERVTLAGDECRKVGVSHKAFRYEPGACAKTVGSCIGDEQLDTLAEADAVRLARGERPHNLLAGRQWGGDASERGSRPGPPTTLADASDPVSPSVRLAFPLATERTTIMTLEIAADGLRYVRRRASGRIAWAESEPFDALSGGGRIIVFIRNEGDGEADLTAQIANCSDSAVAAWRAMPQRRALCPGETLEVEFDVDVEGAQGGEYSCAVELLDSEGRILDSAFVDIVANATETTRGAQGGEAALAGGGAGLGERNPTNSCARDCHLLDLPCAAGRRCWSRLLTGVLTIAAAVLCLRIGVWLAFKKRCFLPRLEPEPAPAEAEASPQRRSHRRVTAKARRGRDDSPERLAMSSPNPLATIAAEDRV